MKQYLPIGSVVLLKDSEKRVMIIGVKQKQTDSASGKLWDYSGCLYPEGLINSDRLFLFDSEQIHTLFFIGFQDGEGLRFLDRLSKSEDE